MINFQLRSYIEALEDLDLAKTYALSPTPEDQVMKASTRQIVASRLQKIERDAANLGMETASHRLARLSVVLQTDNTYDIIHRELEELWNALDHDSHKQFFCHYPLFKVGLLHSLDRDWACALTAFPSIRPEVEAGIDCYALGHNTACVFHMSRVGEIGLRAIGQERGIRKVRSRGQLIPINWGTWGQILGAIDAKLFEVRKKRPNGPQRDNALAFYDTALSDLRALQSLYRDQTMHLRDTYNDGEAQGAMFRARELLIKLSSKLRENSTRAIPWSAWK